MTERQMASKEPVMDQTFLSGGKRKSEVSHDVFLGSSFRTKVVVVGCSVHAPFYQFLGF